MRTHLVLYVCIAVAAISSSGRTADYVWPLSGTPTPDPMNTSFGPRNNYSHWDMHDGIDLPAAIGTPIVAARSGTVFLEGPGGTDGYSSRHVVIKVNDPTDGEMYLVHVHMDSIDGAVTEGGWISQGAQIGTVGDDDATYAHLHFETRKNSPLEVASVHPLRYFPYTDTVNFTVPIMDRRSFVDGSLWVRMRFGAADKNEGDLQRVEVDLKNGGTLLATRAVDFNDKTTIQEGNNDDLAFVNDIAVEGYQTSNMVADSRTDLSYGVIVRNLPAGCDTLDVRVIDVAGNVVSSGDAAIAAHTPEEVSVDFENGQLPPAGWTTLTSPTGTGTTVFLSAAAAHAGSLGVVGQDASTGEATTQRAAVAYTLPTSRIQWAAEAWINPQSLTLGVSDDVYVLYFLDGVNLSVAARIRNVAGTYYAGISAKNPDNSFTGADSATVIAPGVWRKWKLIVKRNGTREATAVLLLDDVSVLRISWDSTGYEPLGFRTPVGLISPGSRAEIAADEIRIGESTDPPPPPTPPDPPPTPPVDPGPATADSPPAAEYGLELDEITVGPVPLRASDAGVVTFRRVPVDGSITIYTITGDRVRTFSPDENTSGTVTWDTLNTGSRRVASGVYLCVFKDSRGNRRTRKIVIVR